MFITQSNENMHNMNNKPYIYILLLLKKYIYIRGVFYVHKVDVMRVMRVMR